MKFQVRMALAVAAATVFALSCSKKKEVAKHAFPDSLAASEVVATVNSEPITGQELKVLAYTAAGMIDSTKSPSFNIRLLDQMVDRTLMAQEAKAAGIAVDDTLVTSVLDRFVRQFGGEAQVDQMLAPMGLTRDDFRQAITRDLTIRKYVDEKITPSITISDADTKAFYDQNPQMFAGTDSVRARHIILLSHQDDSEQQIKDRRAQLEAIRQRAIGGEDFAKLAKTYSQDNLAERGGDLGYFPRGMMVKPFEDAAFALKKGQISNIVDTQFGMHLIKCIDKKPARPVQYDDAKASIDMMLKQRSLSTELQNRLQKSRDAATIVRTYETGA
jgi:peptidyl-prolyl cis-trans isomerase C